MPNDVRPGYLSPAVKMLALTVVVVAFNVACRNDGRDLRPPTAPLPATTTTSLPPAASAPAIAPIATVSAPPVAFSLLAPWQDGSAIPARHTCDDADVSPALAWTNLPPDTVEVAITMNDLDADLVHWVVTGIGLDVTATVEGAAPTGARVWGNDLGAVGWSGPCPPPGEAGHLYLFTVHALNQPLAPADDATARDVVNLLNQTATEQRSVSGTYARAG
jgi:Raf kinase inhibitor-like YbhB/YbcL family protein